jgi:hypothetical protein
MAERKLPEPAATADQESIGTDYQRAGSQFRKGCKDCIAVAVIARMQDMELHAKCAGRRKRAIDGQLGEDGTGRVDQQGHRVGRGNDLV